MYQAGRRIVSHHKRHVVLVWFAAIIILLAIGGVIFAKYFLKSDTTISPPPPAVIKTVTDGNGRTGTFDEGVFSIKLPSDWKFIGHQQSPYNIYSWKNTNKPPGAGARQLQIYYDTIPLGMGVNRVLPVYDEGDHVLADTVSEICQNLYPNVKLPGSSHAPAKYHNVNFLCDFENYALDVVGTSSADGVNTVKVTSSTSGTHKVFFRYSDRSASPNFTIFTDAVESFRLK
ncbi:MAG TPA: hypothetical protein VLG47_06030 [Candidatus Saccharimonadales bacterium]|nr:hypothetical protein [Candidatus Saccharimonadales bacterium]